jgi:hypothetical protein
LGLELRAEGLNRATAAKISRKLADLIVASDNQKPSVTPRRSRRAAEQTKVKQT